MATTIIPGTECPVCGKRHRADSAPLAACMAKLTEAQATQAPKAEVTPEAEAPKAAPRPTTRASVATNANGLRLLLAARKSRKGDGEAIFERQVAGPAFEQIQRDGHAVIMTVEDTVTGNSLPWERKNLKAWMNDPAKLARYDAIFVAETDRLARVDDAGWHYIEHWCYENGKRIITGEGVQFPPRDDSDKYRWIGLKDGARRYLVSVKAKHAETRAIIRANGAAIGKPPFGYCISGEKLHKHFEIDPVTGPLALGAFKRIAQGRSASSVAEWLTEATGKMWRVKRVIDMIKRTSYLGSRDGHTFVALVTKELWDSANAAMAGRSYATGGRRGVHAYSGVILCPCGAPLYHHQSTRSGKPVGVAHYRCASGRRGIAGEAKCSYPALDYDAANAAVDAEMRADVSWPWETRTTGGDAARQAELASIKTEMSAAVAKGNMSALGALSAKFSALDSQPAEPIKTVTTRRLDKTIGEIWAEATLVDQREMLSRYTVTVHPDLNVWVHDLGDTEEAA